MVWVRIETKPVIHPTVTKGPPAAVLQHTMTCSNCTPAMFTKRPIFSFLSKEMRESKPECSETGNQTNYFFLRWNKRKNTNLSDGCFPLCYETAVKVREATKQTLSFFFEPRTRTGQAGSLLSPVELQLQRWVSLIARKPTNLLRQRENEPLDLATQTDNSREKRNCVVFLTEPPSHLINVFLLYFHISRGSLKIAHCLCQPPKTLYCIIA